MRRIFVIISLGLLILSILAVPACGPKEEPKITVSSFMDTETGLLSQMIILMLRANGFEVTDDSNRGDNGEVRKAMAEKKVDIYPDYTGYGAIYFSDSTRDQNIWKDREKGYQTIKELDGKANNFAWLDPAPANDTWAIAVSETLASQENLKTMEQFAAYVNRGGIIKLAASDDFISEKDALPAYQQAYGFSLRKDQLVIMPGANSFDTEKQAANKESGVNAAMAYGTDGYLNRFKLVILQDTRLAQNIFAPTPVIRSEILGKYPMIEDILAPVFGSLDDRTLQSLNSRTGFVGGEVNYLVARDYLIQNNFLKGDPSGFPATLPVFTTDLPDPDSHSKELFNVMMKVESGKLVEKTFTVGPTEAPSRIVGWFMASGGTLNDIKVLVLNDIDFINWKNLHPVEGVYKTDKITTGKLDVPNVSTGNYHLVFDNRFSQFSQKYVLAKVYLLWSDKSNLQKVR